MKENTRNLLVGVTVLVALVLLAGMIVIFQELPAFMRVGYTVGLHFRHAGAVTEGTDVLLSGKRIGRITAVAFTDGDARKGVDIDALIDRGVRIPGNANAYIRTRGFGGAIIDFAPDNKPPGADRKDPATGEPLAWLPTDGSIVVEGAIAGGGMIPAKLRQDISSAAASIQRLADKLDAFFTPPPLPATATNAAAPAATATAPAAPAGLYATLARMNAALEDVHKTLGDPENQANIKAGLANFNAGLASFRKAADGAAKAMAQAQAMLATAKVTFASVSDATRSASKRFDDLAGKLIGDADRLDRVLTSIGRSAASLEKGEGTAGKLLRDPKLYNALVDATDQLKKTLEGLDRLLAEWKEKGVQIRAKLK